VLSDLLFVLLNRFNITLQHASTLVLTVNITVFWDVTPCGLVDSYELFVKTCCLQLQGIKENLHISEYRELTKK